MSASTSRKLSGKRKYSPTQCAMISAGYWWFLYDGGVSTSSPSHDDQLEVSRPEVLGQWSPIGSWSGTAEREHVAPKRRKFSPEFRDEAVKMVIVESRPIADVARKIQVNEGTLGTWVSRYREEHAGEEPPLNISERARLRELERENRELRMKTEFLGKAAAFFAQEYR
jgi:transposase-like protein